MKNISVLAVFFTVIFTAFAAHALDISDFTQSEYAFPANESTELKIAPKTLAGKREALYNFLNFEPGSKVRLITYIDTPDRQLGENSLIIRVREDLSKPKKSKITVKLRADSPKDFGDLKKYRKAEIDIVNGKKYYSASYDIRYNPEDIDVRKVDVAAVMDLIEKKNPEAWSIVGPLLKPCRDRIKQTIVMLGLYWKGRVTEVPGLVWADYTIWSPYYKTPSIFMASLSFKGASSDKNLERVALRIKDAMLANGIFSQSTGSKTQQIFDMSPDFN